MKTYHVDGWQIGGNPSPTGGGYTIFDVDFDEGLLGSWTIYKKGFTNNEAELLAVCECAKLAENDSTIITDSMNTIAWLNRGKAKARPDLNTVIAEGANIIRDKNLKIIWKPRGENRAGRYNESFHDDYRW